MTGKNDELTINADKVLGSKPIGKIFYYLVLNESMTMPEIEKSTENSHATVSEYLNKQIIWGKTFKERLFNERNKEEVYRRKWTYAPNVLNKLFGLFLEEGKFTIRISNKKRLSEEVFSSVILPNLKNEFFNLKKEDFDENQCLGFLIARSLRNAGTWKKGILRITWKSGNHQIAIAKDFNDYIDYPY